jgi:hypothetical protein
MLQGDRPDDGGNNHLWNVGKRLLECTAQEPRRQSSSFITWFAISFLRWRINSPATNHQAIGSFLVVCPRLCIQCICSCPSYQARNKDFNRCKRLAQITDNNTETDSVIISPKNRIGLFYCQTWENMTWRRKYNPKNWTLWWIYRFFNDAVSPV